MPEAMKTIRSRDSSQLLSRLRTEATHYVRQALRQDLVAGLTVAMVSVPQGMSYAAIVGVSPLYGLHAAIVPAIIGALVGSSNHVITGPTNATSLATAGVLLSVAGQPDYAEHVFALAVLSGLIRLILGLLRLGGIVRYVSGSVLTGFLAGAGVLIVVNQLHTLLGLTRPVRANTLELISDLAQHLPRANLYVLVVGLFAFAVLVLVRRISGKMPRALIAVALTSVLVDVSGWVSRGVLLVSDLGPLSEARLAFHIPSLTTSRQLDLLAGASALAVLSLVEAMSIANVVALASNQRIKPSREFVGQGLASVVGGFFRCIPSSGSLARTGVAFSSGARTRAAGAFSGVFVLCALLAFSRYLGYIPVAALAAVVMLSAYGLVDFRHLRLTWESPATNRIVLAVTFAATLLLPLHLAIFLGTVLSIGLYLHESSNIRLSYLELDARGAFVERSLIDCIEQQPSVAVINLEGVLYFAAADELESDLQDVLQSGVKVMILRLRRLHLLAETGVTALQRVFGRAEQLGAVVLISGVTDEVSRFLESSGLRSVVDAERTFKAGDAIFESTREALRRAEEIVGEGG